MLKRELYKYFKIIPRNQKPKKRKTKAISPPALSRIYWSEKGSKSRKTGRNHEEKENKESRQE